MKPFELEDFITEVIVMSHDNFIIVEGAYDQRIFYQIREYLIERYVDNLDTQTQLKKVAVEWANVSGGTHGKGQRGNVESVCYKADTMLEAREIVGFCDRENDDFDTEDDQLLDKRSTQQEIGNIIYTLGHSIENYFFNIETLEHMFNLALGEPENYDKIWQTFFNNINEVLIFACALSCVFEDSDTWSTKRAFAHINHLSTHADYSMLSCSSDGIQFKADKWFDSLNRYHQDRSNFLQKYQNQLTICQNSDIETIVQRCHGHIGESFIWWFMSMIVDEAELESSSESKCQLPVENKYGSSRIRERAQS